jgi:hypothetical protein
VVDYDIKDLEKAGAEYEKLQARLKDVRARLRQGVLQAHAAGHKQVDIIKASRYTRDAVRLIIRGAEGSE